MPTRDQVLAAYRASGDYREVGRRLGIGAGQAYMVATGLPADGGDAFAPEELDRPGALATSTQHLVDESNAAENPTTKPHVLRWMKDRANGDGPLRAAAEARDAQPGEVLEPEETDVATVLTRSHDQVTALLQQLKTVPGVTSGGSAVQLSRRKSIADMVTVALSRHEAAEEEYFWPAIRRLFDDGDQVADAALGQEQEGKDLLVSLGRAGPSEEQFDQLVEKLDHAARAHVAYEDRVLLRLRAEMAEEDRRSLGDRVAKGERRAPARPHHRAPQSPAAAVKVAGAAGAVVDRVRDKAGDRPAKRRGKASSEIEPGEADERGHTDGVAEEEAP